MRRVKWFVSSLVGLLGLVFVPVAAASTVSYIAGDSLWLSNPSGTQKKKLSGPTSDGRVWTEQAQSDNGKVVAVRREPGKIAPLNSFTLFGPTGATLQEGSLTHEEGWFSYAYPVSLDLTDGGVAVYGYSNTNLGYTAFETGTYVRTVEKAYALPPLEITDWEWPTLYKDRLVATRGQEVWLQAPGEGTPFAPDPPDVGFLGVPSGYTINRTDVAANGKLVGIELNYDTIELYPISGVPSVTPAPGENIVGGGGCVLPTQGDASHITISQDGKDIAWEDDRGVVSAGAPDFLGADPCNLTRAPVVLAADGKYPSIGNAALSTGGGGGGGDGGSLTPVPAVPGVVKAAKLKQGIWITVRVGKAGPVVLTGRVGRSVVARGSARAKAAGKVRVKLKAVGAFRKKPQRLKGKTLVLKVTSAGKSKTVRRVLK